METLTTAPQGSPPTTTLLSASVPSAKEDCLEIQSKYIRPEALEHDIGGTSVGFQHPAETGGIYPISSNDFSTVLVESEPPLLAPSDHASCHSLPLQHPHSSPPFSLPSTFYSSCPSSSYGNNDSDNLEASIPSTTTALLPDLLHETFQVQEAHFCQQNQNDQHRGGRKVADNFRVAYQQPLYFGGGVNNASSYQPSAEYDPIVSYTVERKPSSTEMYEPFRSNSVKLPGIETFAASASSITKNFLIFIHFLLT